LWIQALVFADSKEIKEHCIGLGAGDDLYALFAAILTMRPWDKIVDRSIDHLIVPDTPEDRQELQVWPINLYTQRFCVCDHSVFLNEGISM